ncbi:Retrovirus-related Pol polyprotein from transposon RE2 (Retro element 2) (AtRE2) [Includes: Protease RE2 [Durusdinium trenchii]|uniref:Retrovirus-related Pol polyprotein from transposon RE2 (Retro element 2) (AtRE2) n=1 Tax=Durusdinium trenchii TaxID=1381693 RepID=A0ABP0KHL6_9DINO
MDFEYPDSPDGDDPGEESDARRQWHGRGHKEKSQRSDSSDDDMQWGEANEWLEDGAVHWVGHDLSTVYASMDEGTTRTPEVQSRPDSNGFWHQDEDGGYTFWSKATDGEYYTQDQAGTFWAWSDFEDDQVWWSATPEQQKEISEAYANYEGKVRSFAESRALLRQKNLSRGFYPKKGKGKGKPSSFSKGKGAKSAPMPTFVVESPGPSNDVFATSGTPGSAGYTGCFVCRSKGHTFRNCPSRSNTSSSSKGSGKIFMVAEVEEPYESEIPEVSPRMDIPQILSSEVLQPELQGYGVLDTGATESVSSLAALEFIHLRRTELLGHGNHVTVIPGPQKMFRFGNGSLQFSESYVHLKQTVGPHEIDLGVFTLDSKGVPLLIGVRTLERLGAIIDVHQSILVLKTVDPRLVIPLRRSRTGHLLLDLCSNWLDGGARILFMQDSAEADAVEGEKIFVIQEEFPAVLLHAPHYPSTTTTCLSPTMASTSTTTASLPHELLHGRHHEVKVIGSQVLCDSVHAVHEPPCSHDSSSTLVENLFPVFEELHQMPEFVEEPIVLEETFGSTTPFSPALLAEERNSDLGMSLRILAILEKQMLEVTNAAGTFEVDVNRFDTDRMCGKPETKPKAKATQGYIKEEPPRDPEVMSQTPGRKARKPEDAAELLEYQNRSEIQYKAEETLDLGAVLSKYDIIHKNVDMDPRTVLLQNDTVLENLAMAMSSDLQQNEFVPDNDDIENEVPDYLLEPLRYYEAPGEEQLTDDEHGYGPEKLEDLAPEDQNFIEETLQEKRLAFEDCLVNNAITTKLGMKRLTTDGCVWILQDPKSQETLGYVASHVDDFLISGSPDHPLWQKTVEAFKGAFSWSPWESTPFTHCGIGVSQEADWSFRLSHHTFVEELRPIVIDDKSEMVTAQEMNQARALLGAMQWRSIQTGPQHSSKVSWLQSSLPKGGKDVLHQINKLSRELHHQRYLSVSTRQLGAESVDDIGFVCYTDAAVANRPNFASTGGHLVGMVHRSYLQGKKGFVNPISWRSHKLVRVARSSLSAEVQAMAEGEQELMFVRAEWSELLGRPLDLLHPELSTQHVPAAIITDAKSVYDCVSKGDTTSFNMKEKYTALELMAVFNHLEAQRTALLWVASDSQLADGLTKGSASEMLTRFFQGHQVWAASFDPEFVAAKKKKGKTSTTATSHEPDEEAEFDEDLSWRDLVSKSRTARSETFHEEFLGHVGSFASAFECSLQDSDVPARLETGTPSARVYHRRF